MLENSMRNGMLPVTKPGLQERCARWLLLLTLLHTVPVIWITPVSAGTAPTAALLAYGLASLFTFDPEGVAIGLFALGPALVYCAIGWALAWTLARLLQRARQPLRAALLAILTAVPLVSVYWPIYSAGGHNGSRSANLIGLFERTIDWRVLIAYWIALHVVLAALYVGHLLRNDHPALGFVERWRKPALKATAVALCMALLYGNYPMLVCRPLAELGSGRAALCVAQSDRRDQRHWYERAAEKGQTEAIAWMIEHTHDREKKLHWLRKGAELGDAQIQFALYERLMRFGGAGARAEAEVWLRNAAEGGHAPAQMVFLDALTKSIYRSQSTELLAERNAWLERAARRGARDAKRQLAQHYVDGSMGYAPDFDRARDYYRELATIDNENKVDKTPRLDQRTDYERMLGLDAAYYNARIAELDAWETGIDNGDPIVTKLVAERYLKSQFPGPGVRELGLEMMEQLATAGDTTARDALILGLRTGSGGIEEDLDASKAWLISAAEAGDVDAMERAAGNYTRGREGFTVDYPEAQRWFRAAIEIHSGSDTDGARARVYALQKELAFIDRRAEQAGGTLIGSQALTQLGEGADAESNYQYALQLLAGHGPDRRAEAIARLNEASRQGHADAAWRLVWIYERGFPADIDQAAAVEQLQRAAANHQFDATRELAMRYEYGKRGLPTDLPQAIALYENALAAGHDNRYGWNLDPDNYNHYKWLESRLRQARMKQTAQTGK